MKNSPCMIWVRKPKFIADTGMTESEVNSKVRHKKWINGTHYLIRDRAMWLNPRAIEVWLVQNIPEASDTTEAAGNLDSVSKKRVSSTVSRQRKIKPILIEQNDC